MSSAMHETALYVYLQHIDMMLILAAPGDPKKLHELDYIAGSLKSKAIIKCFVSWFS